MRWGNDTRAGKGYRQKNQAQWICLKNATIKLNTLQVSYKNQTNKRSINEKRVRNKQTPTNQWSRIRYITHILCPSFTSKHEQLLERTTLTSECQTGKVVILFYHDSSGKRNGVNEQAPHWPQSEQLCSGIMTGNFPSAKNSNCATCLLTAIRVHVHTPTQTDK